MSRVSEATIGRRTRIKWCDDESARCNGSNHHDPPNAFSASMRRSTTTSMFNATSSPDPFYDTSETKPTRSGTTQSQPHDVRAVVPAHGSHVIGYRDNAAARYGDLTVVQRVAE